MPIKLICCMLLPPATILSVLIYDFANANEELAGMSTEQYYSCCGNSICRGCIYSFCESGNIGTCPYCNADMMGKTDGDRFEEVMKRVEANDAGSIYVIGNDYYHGGRVLLQDRERALELWKQAGTLGLSQAHFQLGAYYHVGGDSKKKKFHYEAAAMAGHEVARYNLGYNEYHAGNTEQAVKHWIIAASAGYFSAMNALLTLFEKGYVSRDAINSTLTAYNNSCSDVRSGARDAVICIHSDGICNNTLEQF